MTAIETPTDKEADRQSPPRRRQEDPARHIVKNVGQCALPLVRHQRSPAMVPVRAMV